MSDFDTNHQDKALSCEGAGLGLRFPHLREVLRETPDVPWFEVHVCNYMSGGLSRALLDQIAERYPLSFHGVSLNLGGTEPLDKTYLKQLTQMAEQLKPGLISEHACFTQHGDVYFHDLLPVPFTEEAVTHMASRVNQVQDQLGQAILLENLSRYYLYPESGLSEAEFLTALCEETGCGLLLDLNNAYVNQRNLGESVSDFLQALPAHRVGEIHLAGFTEVDGRLIDTHASEVCDEVWEIYADFIAQHGAVPTLIEWDSQLPEFSILQAHRHKAEAIMNSQAEVA